MMRMRFLLRSKIAAALFGVAFLLFGCLSLFTTNTDTDNLGYTTATVIYHSDNRDYASDVSNPLTRVEYSVNGQTYTAEYTYYSAFDKPGKQIKIGYSLTNPQDSFSVSSNKLAWMLPMGVGGAVLLWLAGEMIVTRVKGGANTNLMETGSMVTLPVKEIRTDYSFAVNGRHPTRIYCEYPGPDGETLEFKSKNLWEDPAYVMQRDNVETVTVYYNPENPKKYYMDVSFLEK